MQLGIQIQCKTLTFGKLYIANNLQIREEKKTVEEGRSDFNINEAMSMISDSMVPVHPSLENLNSPLLSKVCAWGVMLGLFVVSIIAMAYACYYTQNASNQSTGGQDNPIKKEVLKPLDMEPKIVVIMAGNENPTFFAKPSKINA